MLIRANKLDRVTHKHIKRTKTITHRSLLPNNPGKVLIPKYTRYVQQTTCLSTTDIKINCLILFQIVNIQSE